VKKLGVLIYKEWRDQRVLMLGAFVVCLLAIVIAKLLHGTHFDPLARTRFVLPGCLALFTLVLATEAITREAQNGVEGTLLRLPVPRATAWLAKIGFITFSVVGFLVLLVLVELTLRILEHRSALDGLVAMIQPTWWLLIAALGAACVASACILKRSLPAAFLGLVLVSGVPLFALALPDGRAREWSAVLLCSLTPAELSALACCAFLIGSFFAFCVRRPDVFGFRRATGAATGIGIVVVPIVAFLAHALARAFDMRPFSRTAEIERISPSPDGRFLAVQAAQYWVPRDNWIDLSEEGSRTGQRVRREVWIFDCVTRAWQKFDDRFRSIIEWNSDGTLHTTSSAGYFGADKVLVERIDPLTDGVVSSHPDDGSESLGHWYQRRIVGNDTVLRWISTGRELRLPRSALMRPATQPGVVFHEQDGSLVRHELQSDSTTKLAELGAAHDSSVRVSPDGRHVYLVNGSTRRVLDARDGSLVHDCAGSGLADWSRVPGRIGLFCAGRMEWTMLMEDGSLTTLPTHALRCQELGPDHLLAYDQQRIECMKLDGTDRQVLYEARP